MSRTYKDRPERIRFPEQYKFFDTGYEKVSYPIELKDGDGEVFNFNTYWLRELPGVKTKKPKHQDTHWHWMSTPSWWTRMTMNRPLRRKVHLWEHEVVKNNIEELEEADHPDTGHKPHNYYW